MLKILLSLFLSLSNYQPDSVRSYQEKAHKYPEISGGTSNKIRVKEISHCSISKIHLSTFVYIFFDKNLLLVDGKILELFFTLN